MTKLVITLISFFLNSEYNPEWLLYNIYSLIMSCN